MVAVQASRISTYLHINGVPMGDPTPTSRKCPTPCTSFFSSCKRMGGDAVWGNVPPLVTALFSPPALNARSARVLFLLVAPGHLIFLYTISSLRGGHTTLTPIFISLYLAAALLQVLSPEAGLLIYVDLL